MTLLSMLFNLALSSKHPGSERYLSVGIELGCLEGVVKKFSHRIRSVIGAGPLTNPLPLPTLETVETVDTVDSLGFLS